MVYGLTIPLKSQITELAQFVNSKINKEKGQAILQRLGQDPVGDFYNPYFEKLPESIRKRLSPQV